MEVATGDGLTPVPGANCDRTRRDGVTFQSPDDSLRAIVNAECPFNIRNEAIFERNLPSLPDRCGSWTAGRSL